MFFVTVGTAPQPFQRLINIMLSFPPEVQQNIFFQGYVSKNTTLPFSHKRFITPDEYKQKMCESELVICHAGVGSVREAYELEKRTIVIPRLSKYKEHFNNHQLELVEYLLKNPLPNIYPLKTPEGLLTKIEEVSELPLQTRLPVKLGQELEEAITEDVLKMLQ